MTQVASIEPWNTEMSGMPTKPKEIWRAKLENFGQKFSTTKS